MIDDRIEADMRPSAIAQLYMHIDRDRAAQIVGTRTVLGDLHVELSASSRAVPWAGTSDALRWTGRWCRGGVEGRVVVDLVVAGATHTLLLIELAQPEAWFARPMTHADARAAAVQLRAMVEAGRHGPVAPSVDPAAGSTGTPTTAAAAATAASLRL